MAASIYIHIPFCATKCYYCAFNTYTFHKQQAKTYLTALGTEMELYASETEPLQTIFIGGGTTFYPVCQRFSATVRRYPSVFPNNTER